MDRNLGMEAVRVTEAAALAAARWVGKGEEKAADESAMEAMRRTLNSCGIRGKIVIGPRPRGEKDILTVGDEVGSDHPEHPEFDIALEPLEGTTITATGSYNALSVIAFAPKGGMLAVPDIYMDKIAVGPEGRGVIEIESSPTENLKRLAKAKSCYVDDLTAIILDRPRHESLIREIREAGARIRLIGDGDLSAALAPANPDSGIDILFGIGGAAQGVLAAAALKCIGGDLKGRLVLRNEQEKEQARQCGIPDQDFGRVYGMDDLTGGKDIVVAATGVTDGDFLRGVRFFSGGAGTHSVVMRSASRTTRFISARHYFDYKPSY